MVLTRSMVIPMLLNGYMSEIGEFWGDGVDENDFYCCLLCGKEETGKFCDHIMEDHSKDFWSWIELNLKRILENYEDMNANLGQDFFFKLFFTPALSPFPGYPPVNYGFDSKTNGAAPKFHFDSDINLEYKKFQGVSKDFIIFEKLNEAIPEEFLNELEDKIFFNRPEPFRYLLNPTDGFTFSNPYVRNGSKSNGYSVKSLVHLKHNLEKERNEELQMDIELVNMVIKRQEKVKRKLKQDVINTKSEINRLQEERKSKELEYKEESMKILNQEVEEEKLNIRERKNARPLLMKLRAERLQNLENQLIKECQNVASDIINEVVEDLLGKITYRVLKEKRVSYIREKEEEKLVEEARKKQLAISKEKEEIENLKQRNQENILSRASILAKNVSKSQGGDLEPVSATLKRMDKKYEVETGVVDNYMKDFVEEVAEESIAESYKEKSAPEPSFFFSLSEDPFSQSALTSNEQPKKENEILTSTKSSIDDLVPFSKSPTGFGFENDGDFTKHHEILADLTRETSFSGSPLPFFSSLTKGSPKSSSSEPTNYSALCRSYGYNEDHCVVVKGIPENKRNEHTLVQFFLFVQIKCDSNAKLNFQYIDNGDIIVEMEDDSDVNDALMMNGTKIEGKTVEVLAVKNKDGRSTNNNLGHNP